jgi:MOSC domain-containing protein YiiM
LMDYFHLGLRKALAPDWRGGVTCKVTQGGTVIIGDAVTVTKELFEQRPQLPG